MINSTINAANTVEGQIIPRARINGQPVPRVRIGGQIGTAKTQKELRFMPKDQFPEPGSTSVLYVATDEGAIYYWDGDHYVAASGSGGAEIIDDDGVYDTKTWSSRKIDGEFRDDQNQIDNLAYEKITNGEIDSIIT